MRKSTEKNTHRKLAITWEQLQIESHMTTHWMRMGQANTMRPRKTGLDVWYARNNAQKKH